MLQNKAYAAYANNKIMTASPAELTLMLYDGAIKFCNIAIMAVEKEDIQQNPKVIRLHRWFRELRNS
jgi:flagellar protein FliS